MALVWNLPFPLFLIYGHKLCFTVFSATVALQQSPPSPKQQLASLANMNFGTWEIEKMVDGKMSCCYGCNRSRAGAALQPAALPAQHSTVCGVRATLPCTALNISWLSNTALSTRKIARYCTVLCSYGWSTGTVLYCVHMAGQQVLYCTVLCSYGWSTGTVLYCTLFIWLVNRYCTVHWFSTYCTVH